MFNILRTNQSNLKQTDNGAAFYNKPFQDLMKTLILSIIVHTAV